jgi:hypothetical protein
MIRSLQNFVDIMKLNHAALLYRSGNTEDSVAKTVMETEDWKIEET